MSKSDCGRVRTGSFGGGGGAGYFSVAWRFRSNDNDNNIYFIRVSISQKEIENITRAASVSEPYDCEFHTWARKIYLTITDFGA